MEGLRQICDQHGIVLIADEVQTGFGRTGKMFAMEHYAVEPDLICVAKSLAGGFPLSGVIGRAAIMDAADPGGLGGTYAGNPLACAAALAVLDVFEEENLLERSNAIGARVKARLELIRASNSCLPIAAIRGPGAMVAFDIVRERGSDEPDAGGDQASRSAGDRTRPHPAVVRDERQHDPHPDAADRVGRAGRRRHGPSGGCAADLRRYRGKARLLARSDEDRPSIRRAGRRSSPSTKRK